MELITSEDINLGSKKYSEKELVIIVENCSVHLLSILSTQKLSSVFCKKYFIHELKTWAVDSSDEDITESEILFYQKHLKIEDLK